MRLAFGNAKRLENDNPDRPRISSLLAVGYIARPHPGPAARSFVAVRGACAGAHALRTHSDLALHIGLQIHVPARMRGRAALRADDDVPSVTHAVARSIFRIYGSISGANAGCFDSFAK